MGQNDIVNVNGKTGQRKYAMKNIADRSQQDSNLRGQKPNRFRVCRLNHSAMTAFESKSGHMCFFYFRTSYQPRNLAPMKQLTLADPTWTSFWKAEALQKNSYLL